MRTWLLVALMALSFCEPVEAQLLRRFRQTCPSGVCPTPQFAAPSVLQECEPAVIEPAAMPQSDDETAATSEWFRSAAQFRVSNSCGSGSVVGFIGDDTLLLSNAHVTGTRPGTAVTIRMRIDGKDVTYQGTVIMAAYSNTTQADWSITRVRGRIPVEPRPLSIERPSGDHVTVGSPRCVWPLKYQEVKTVRASENMPLWQWTPNSIGGQSGSGVWSPKDGNQYGLLTWSWNGLGAGQQTYWIYRQATEKTVAGEPRLEGMKELTPRPEGVVVEEGFFAESDIDQLPIWSKPGVDPPKPEPAPPVEFSESEVKNLRTLRAAAREKGVDWMQIVLLILELIKLFQARS
jgi:hypothetical protein